MDIYTASEVSYKNGYEAGVKEFTERLFDNFISNVQKRYCIIGGSEHSCKYTEGYTVDDVLSNIDTTLKELTESKNDFEG